MHGEITDVDFRDDDSCILHVTTEKGELVLVEVDPIKLFEDGVMNHQQREFEKRYL
jgi:hypothetical protein